MARHVHVVVEPGRPRHRREAEAVITRRVELVVSAVAGLAAPMLHGGLPALSRTEPPSRRVDSPRRRAVPDLV